MDHDVTRRDLSESENAVLHLVAARFGPHNTQEEVEIHGNDEAVIWAKDGAGATVMLVNLTTLAARLADETVSGEVEVLRDWLIVDVR